MSNTEPRETAKMVVAQRDAAEWNARYEIGTPVIYRGGDGDMHTTTRSAAYVPRGMDFAAVFIANKAGFVVLSFVTKRYIDEEMECLSQFAS